MHPAFDSTSHIPLALDPELKNREGVSKKVPWVLPQKLTGPSLKKSLGSSAPGPKTPSEPSPRKSHLVGKQKAAPPEDNRDKKRKAPGGGEIVLRDQGAKKAPLSLKGPSQETSPKGRGSKERTSALPILEYLPEHLEELDDEFRKQLKAIIPDPEKGKGVVWRTNLPKDYPDSLGVYFPGYTRMQNTLEPTEAERVDYSCEA